MIRLYGTEFGIGLFDIHKLETLLEWICEISQAHMEETGSMEIGITISHYHGMELARV